VFKEGDEVNVAVDLLFRHGGVRLDLLAERWKDLDEFSCELMIFLVGDFLSEVKEVAAHDGLQREFWQ
jgi:hypothetical protein